MCTGMEVPALVGMYSAIAGTALSGYSAYESGKTQEEWGSYQAKQSSADATAELGAAEVEADRIRKMARQQASAANAALANAGVETGEGTALNINHDIYYESEQDAMLTVLGGKDRYQRGMAESSGYNTRGKQAKQAGNINIATSLLDGSYKVASGWKTK